MKQLLFIGHSYHNKTKSSQFIQDLLKEKYNITKIDFDPYKDSFNVFNIIEGQVFDTVVLWQIMPSINELKKLITFKKIAFFPMYDSVTDFKNAIWYQYKDCNIISFSKTLYEECLKRGFATYYIKYFPSPKEIFDMGDEKSVFLWQRVNKINPITVNKVIGLKELNKLYHHQAPDPCHKIIDAPLKYQDKIEISTWFDTKDALDRYIQKSAIYFAPRKLEGIGMSFLEAMAMGRCVIAPNNPTMNEYIQDGYNGFLYNIKNPEKINIKDIKKVQQNTIDFIKNGYAKWEQEKYQILQWLENDVTKNRNDNLIEKKVNKYDIEKKKIKIHITYLTKKIMNTHDVYYLFGILPIFKKEKRGN